MWEIILPLDGPTFAILCWFWCPHSKNTQSIEEGRLGAFDASWPTFAPPNPLSIHFWTQFRILTETHLKPTLSWNELSSKKGPEAALTQHNLRAKRGRRGRRESQGREGGCGCGTGGWWCVPLDPLGLHTIVHAIYTYYIPPEYFSVSGRQAIMERKKPIKKNHIKEFGGRMPQRRPRDKLGTSQGHLGHLGLIYV